MTVEEIERIFITDGVDVGTFEILKIETLSDTARLFARLKCKNSNLLRIETFWTATAAVLFFYNNSRHRQAKCLNYAPVTRSPELDYIPKLLDIDMGKLQPPKEFSTMGCGTLLFVKNHSHADLDRIKEYWLGIRKTAKPLKGRHILRLWAASLLFKRAGGCERRCKEVTSIMEL